MPLPADYHMHTPLCRHATGEPWELAAQAAAIGLEEIGFSDHGPMPRDDFDDWRMRASDLEAYVAKVEKARQDHPGLRIRLALEIDFLPGYEDWIRDLAGRYPWDYLVGSVHYAFDKSWAIDNPAQKAEWRRRNVREIWAGYAARLTQAAESGLFDVIAHPDLCKKFGFYPDGDSTEVFAPFLGSVRRRGIAMELNTAGLRKECREIYPSAGIVRRASELGIPIVFGSDAHAPGEVGMNFAEAIALARQAGYTHWRRFERRSWRQVPI